MLNPKNLQLKKLTWRMFIKRRWKSVALDVGVPPAVNLLYYAIGSQWLSYVVYNGFIIPFTIWLIWKSYQIEDKHYKWQQTYDLLKQEHAKQYPVETSTC
jgi:hypothetical protein